LDLSPARRLAIDLLDFVSDTDVEGRARVKSNCAAAATIPCQMRPSPIPSARSLLPTSVPSEEVEGDETRVVAAAQSAAAECAGKSPRPEPERARATDARSAVLGSNQ
jgi:hypothetical protein